MEQTKLLFSSTIRSFKKGAHIHNSKADCLGALFVIEGSLRAYLLSDNGREITLFHIEESECCVLSASCILPLITFDIFVDALADTRLLVVAPLALSELIEENIHIDSFAYRQTAERFSEVMWVFHQVLFVSFDRRLASCLIEESNLAGKYTVAMTHEQLAKDLGSAREVVTRMLKYFQQEGLVRLSRGTITILDPAKLRELARP